MCYNGTLHLISQVLFKGKLAGWNHYYRNDTITLQLLQLYYQNYIGQLSDSFLKRELFLISDGAETSSATI